MEPYCKKKKPKKSNVAFSSVNSITLYIYLCISLQIVIQYVNTDSKVSGVVRVRPVPALRAKLTPLNDTSMEIHERE